MLSLTSAGCFSFLKQSSWNRVVTASCHDSIWRRHDLDDREPSPTFQAGPWNRLFKDQRSHPSSLQQLPSKLLCWVVEGELLAAKVIHRWMAVQVQKEVVVEANFLRFFLRTGIKSPEQRERVRSKVKRGSVTLNMQHCLLHHMRKLFSYRIISFALLSASIIFFKCF